MSTPTLKHKAKLPRREYIDLLSEYAIDPKFSPKESKAILMSRELQRENYLSGSSVNVMTKTPDECPIVLIAPAITVKGRLFLQKLQKEEKADTWWGKSQKHFHSVITILIGWIIGVSTPLLVDAIKKVLGLSN